LFTSRNVVVHISIAYFTDAFFGDNYDKGHTAVSIGICKDLTQHYLTRKIGQCPYLFEHCRREYYEQIHIVLNVIALSKDALLTYHNVWFVRFKQRLYNVNATINTLLIKYYI